jgi:uncharacterized protein (TIGR02271 family)
VTAYFDTPQAAEQAAFDLAKQVSGVRAQVFDSKSSTSDLSVLSIPQEDLATLREGFRRGGATVYAEIPDNQFETAATALEASGAIDLNEREAAWRQEGWTGSSTSSSNQTSPAAVMPTSAGSAASRTAGVEHLGPATSEEHIPIVEETVRVGKREVEHGRVRVRSYVVETPVSEQVSLREEHVDVSRHAVNRPLTDADDAFRERVIEATEHAEEAVVSKEARVREEVVIHKETEERVETVQDTVRRTEVEVDDGRTSGTAASNNSSGTVTGRSVDHAPDTKTSGANPKR